jgi:RNA recognition motif-containing protein
MDEKPSPALQRRTGPRCNRRSSGHTSAPHQAVPLSAPRASSLFERTTNVFLNYVPRSFTEADLCALCAEYGTILCCKIMINLETGQSKGFGFVRFSTLDEADAAIQGLNGRRIEGKRLFATFAESRERRDRASAMLYVKRLPLTVDQRHVVDLFVKYGEIEEVVPHILDSVDPKFWRILIRYSTAGAAAAALAGMNNQIIAPGTRPIHVRYADASRITGNFQPVIPFDVPPLIEEEGTAQLLPSFLLAGSD